MATIQGSAGGQTLTVNASTLSQQAVAQAIFGSAASVYTASSAEAVDPAGGAASVITSANATLMGDPAASGTQYALLNGSGETYDTNGAPNSVVAGADQGNETIVNRSASSNLVATTGTGVNMLAGLAGHNNFTTAAGGVDTVILKGSSNTLTSNGTDTIAVVKSSAIFAGPSAIDMIRLAPGASLSFTNTSAAPLVDSITGASGSTIAIAGPGSTSVTAGAGPERFFIDTAAGNVTLNASSSATDSFTFVKDLTATGSAPANVTIANYRAGDMVDVHGYAGSQYTLGSNASGFAVLNLTDGATVTFTNVTAAQLQGKIKVI